MARVFTELGGEYGRRRRRGGGEDGEDRISQLPDEIVHTSILCCLDSPEEAARTSVLSKRWLQLWRSHPFVDFDVSKGNRRFSSFVDSTCRRLLRPSDSDHSSSSSSSSSGSAAVATAIQGLSITLYDLYQEEIDRLLSLINNASCLSVFKLELKVSCSFVLPYYATVEDESNPSYSLQVPNWSRTRIINLAGCDLLAPSGTGFGFDGNRNGVYLGSLECLSLQNVSVSDQLLNSFLANAPRLVSLRLSEIFGIDRLELVSSPHLRTLHLYNGLQAMAEPGS